MPIGCSAVLLYTLPVFALGSCCSWGDLSAFALEFRDSGFELLEFALRSCSSGCELLEFALVPRDSRSELLEFALVSGCFICELLGPPFLGGRFGASSFFALFLCDSTFDGEFLPPEGALVGFTF